MSQVWSLPRLNASNSLLGSKGTIKHAQLAAITHNREIIARYRALKPQGKLSYEIMFKLTDLFSSYQSHPGMSTNRSLSRVHAR